MIWKTQRTRSSRCLRDRGQRKRTATRTSASPRLTPTRRTTPETASTPTSPRAKTGPTSRPRPPRTTRTPRTTTGTEGVGAGAEAALVTNTAQGTSTDLPKRSLRRAAASTGAVVPASTTSTAPVGGVAVRTNTRTRAGRGNGSTARHPQNTTKSGPGAEIKEDTTDLSLNKIRYLISLSKIQFALFQS